MESWSAEVENVKGKLEALSDEDFEIAYNAVINEGATTWEDITAAIEEYNNIYPQEVVQWLFGVIISSMMGYHVRNLA